MVEEGTAVLDAPEEMTPGGVFTKAEYETLQQDITKLAADKGEAEIPSEPVATETTPEPEAKPADDLSSEPSAGPADTAEPEVPESTPEPQEPAAEDSPVEFDDQLLARAEQMGFSKERAQKFGTPDNLESALIVLDQRLIEMATPKATPPPPATPPVTPPATVERTQPAPARQAPISELSIDLDPEEHAPEIVEQFKKLHSHYEARAAQFEQAFVGLVQQLQAGQQQSEQQFIDRSIDALDDKIKDLITPEIRKQIGPGAMGLKQSLAQNGLHVPSGFDLIKRSAQGLLSEQLLKQEHTRTTNEISEKLERRAAQRTSRPVSHRSTDPAMSSKERKDQAVKDIDAFKRDRGMR